jgi:selenocysteine-specific translation elongation factor
VGIEKFRRPVKSAYAGERIGVVLHGVTKDEVSRGDILENSHSLANEYFWEN